MAVIRVTQAISGNMVTVIRDAVDVDANAGYIEGYTGSMVAKPETAPGGGNTKLFTCPCSVTSGTIASGVLTFNAITTDTLADATGTLAWIRVRDGAGQAVMDLDVSVTGGSGFAQVPTTSIVANGPVAFSSFTVNISPGTW